ncbi:MAG: hypothetical protein ABI193_08585 [Minicystis sp.]
MTTGAQGTRAISKVIIWCVRDAKKPGVRIPKLVVCSPERGKEVIEIELDDVREGAEGRSIGVFGPKACPNLQAYTLLIHLSRRENGRKKKLTRDELNTLEGWSLGGKDPAADVRAAMRRYVVGSSVLDCTSDRPCVRAGVVLEFDPPEEEGAIVAWAYKNTRGSSEEFADLVAEIEALLARARELMEALVRLKYADGAADGLPRRLAQALLKAEPGRVAKDLADLTKERPGLRDKARDLLCVVLPQAKNWDELVLQVEEAMAGRRSLVLRVRTETVAEILVARDQGRACEYLAGATGYLRGANQISMPASGEAAIGNRALADDILLSFVRATCVAESHLPRTQIWLRQFQETDDPEERKSVARRIIKRFEGDPKGLYLLVLEGRMKMGEEELQTWWRDVEDNLPGLRLVLLKGGQEEMDTESPIVSSIEDVYGHGR